MGRRMTELPDEIRIVFDGSPGPEMPRLVEVEDAQGRSITVGEWVRRSKDRHELRIRLKPERKPHV
jgi:methionine-rich copper-binding protein CopC